VKPLDSILRFFIDHKIDPNVPAASEFSVRRLVFIYSEVANKDWSSLKRHAFANII
jgi:hypothetical protein